MIICRDIKAEACEYHDHIVHHADTQAVQNYFNHFAMADCKAWGQHDLQGRIVGDNVRLIAAPSRWPMA